MLIHTKPEVIETGGQEEKQEEMCPGAGHVSTWTGSLGTFQSFKSLRQSVVTSQLPSKKEKMPLSLAGSHNIWGKSHVISVKISLDLIQIS